jgi:hypothetical protein
MRATIGQMTERLYPVSISRRPACARPTPLIANGVVFLLTSFVLTVGALFFA